MPDQTTDAVQSRLALETHQIIFLRADGLANLALGLVLFMGTEQSWWFFALWMLIPDLSALGYLISARVGAVCYNLGHSYLGPALMLGIGWMSGAQPILAIGAIWWVHIAADRVAGYGFKRWRSFKRTHLSFA